MDNIFIETKGAYFFLVGRDNISKGMDTRGGRKNLTLLGYKVVM